MPNDRYEWQERIGAVQREHSAMRFAVDRLLIAATHDASVLGGDFKLRDIRHASELLDGTYVIRLFAEFEAGLR